MGHPERRSPFAVSPIAHKGCSPSRHPLRNSRQMLGRRSDQHGSSWTRNDVQDTATSLYSYCVSHQPVPLRGLSTHPMRFVGSSCFGPPRIRLSKPIQPAKNLQRAGRSCNMRRRLNDGFHGGLLLVLSDGKTIPP